MIPLFTDFFDYFTSNVKKLGVNLPKEVARDWKTFITHPNSILELPNRNGNFYNTIDKKMLMISFSNDNMSPGKAVDVLANKVYNFVDMELLHIEADESAPVGHLKFLKNSSKTIYDLFRLNGMNIESTPKSRY